jgi:hypothetical protein
VAPDEHAQPGAAAAAALLVDLEDEPTVLSRATMRSSWWQKICSRS